MLFLSSPLFTFLIFFIQGLPYQPITLFVPSNPWPPENEACAAYAQCGLNRYTECISGLTSLWGDCCSKTDSIEVELEGRRVRNQVAPACEPYTIEDIMACLNLQNFFRKMSGWFGYWRVRSIWKGSGLGWNKRDVFSWLFMICWGFYVSNILLMYSGTPLQRQLWCTVKTGTVVKLTL